MYQGIDGTSVVTIFMQNPDPDDVNDEKMSKSGPWDLQQKHVGILWEFIFQYRFSIVLTESVCGRMNLVE